MSWNWFFAIILLVFIGMHFFGHGGCGGHGGHQHSRRDGQQPDPAEGRDHERQQEPAHHGCH